jgi:hypothetical protein
MITTSTTYTTPTPPTRNHQHTQHHHHHHVTITHRQHHRCRHCYLPLRRPPSTALIPDDHPDTDHWPPQLYVRAARRLLGDRVFNQNTPTLTRLWGNESIGCGSYNFDSHTAERMACLNATVCGGDGPPGISPTQAYAWNEGDVETGPGAYDIPLWVLLPKRQQATNLLVVASPSASHIGMSTWVTPPPPNYL